MSDKLIGCVQHDCDDCKRREQEMAELRAKLAATEPIANLVRKKMTSGNGIRVSRCVITDQEIDALDAAMKEQA